ncbi:MAG: HigA family addiction module antidote protein [Actinobacteria bacterium]|nr:HigA family addiction module antidote protein [Actinomycetota bacterium]
MGTATSTTGFHPDYVVAPGETLAELLDERGMTQKELALRLRVSAKHVSQVATGVAPISARLAIGLERVLGAPAEFWLSLEGRYRTGLARSEERTALAEPAAVAWASAFPVKELAARGLIPKRLRGSDLVAEMLRFLGLAEPGPVIVGSTNFRRSTAFASDSNALDAWMRIGELRAAELECAPFDARRFLAALATVRSLTRLEPEVWHAQLVELCAEAGVAVVIEEALHGARANGATRWLSPSKALVLLSLRYRYEDVFWFTFFHEAGHIVLHRKGDAFIESDEKAGDPEWERLEAEANEFAATTLIPERHTAALDALSVDEIPAFADRIGVAPAIVAGRIAHQRGNWPSVAHLRRRFEFRRVATA